MKVRTHLPLFILLFIFPTTLLAQIWFHKEATWHHYSYEGLTNIQQIQEVRIEKDTIINDLAVKKLSLSSKHTSAVEEGVQQRGPFFEYWYEQNDSVFFYNENTQTFDLIYDFTLQVGEMISFYMDDGCDTIRLVLDSIAVQDFGNTTRRIQHFRLLPNPNDPLLESFGFPADLSVIEGIGSLRARMPKYDFFCATDLPFDNLRCFSDGSISYNPNGFICDIIDEVVPTVDLRKNLSIQVYPNPINDFLQIHTIPWQTISKVQIYNVLGTSIAEFAPMTNQLFLGHLPKGTYFLKIYVDQQFLVKKVIKT